MFLVNTTNERKLIMKKLPITKEAFEKSKYFNRKYGKLEYVSESGKLFKTNKGHVIKFVNESEEDDTEKEFTWMGLSITRYDYESLPSPMAATKCPDRMMKAIVKSIYYDLINNCGWSPKDIEKYLAPGVDEYDFEGEEARKADKIKSDFWTYMERAAVSHGMKYYEDMDDEEQVNESDGGSAWFDNRGDMLKTLPGDCIMACARQGRVDDDVAFWVEELDFTNGLPRERTINYLREYGAWDDEELNEMTSMSLAEKVLWIFCNDLKELAYEMMDDETSLVADWGDPSTWGDDEWERFQKEYSYCSLNA